MRFRSLVLAGLLATGVIAVGVSSSQAATSRIGCGQKSVTFLFWPHGHHAIPSVGFPEFLVPHMEIYKPGTTYPNSNFLGSLTAQGSASVVSSCHRVGGTSGSSKIDKSKATGNATALTCKSKKAPVFEFTQLAGGGVRLRAFLGQAAEIVTNIRAQGSSLKYDKTHCKAASPPS
jgi:hypothetical protein